LHQWPRGGGARKPESTPGPSQSRVSDSRGHRLSVPGGLGALSQNGPAAAPPAQTARSAPECPVGSRATRTNSLGVMAAAISFSDSDSFDSASDRCEPVTRTVVARSAHSVHVAQDKTCKINSPECPPCASSVVRRATYKKNWGVNSSNRSNFYYCLKKNIYPLQEATNGGAAPRLGRVRCGRVPSDERKARTCISFMSST
jgi:hypothetical protein